MNSEYYQISQETVEGVAFIRVVCASVRVSSVGYVYLPVRAII